MGSGEEGKWRVGEEATPRNLVFFRVKWLQPAMKGTSSVRRLRLGSFLSRIVPPMCFATMVVPEVWSVKCEVWSVKKAVRSEKCEVWTVKCEVWTVKFGVRRVQCDV